MNLQVVELVNSIGTLSLMLSDENKHHKIRLVHNDDLTVKVLDDIFNFDTMKFETKELDLEVLSEKENIVAPYIQRVKDLVDKLNKKD